MIDLHMHSHFSEDGELPPEELVRLCAQIGITTMSVTDHNCVKANKIAAKEAAKYNIHYIPGIEIDCMFEDLKLHILGYGINSDSDDFLNIEKNIEEQGMKNSFEMLEKIQCLGFQVSEKELWELAKDNYWSSLWTGEMFAEVLLAKEEYRYHPLLEAYRPGGERSDNPYVNFYWDFCAQGKPCYVKMEYPSAKEIVDIIHRNGGIAILAHPGVNLNRKEDRLPGIMELGMDGIEAYSSYHTVAQREFYLRQAESMHKIVSSGSDFHGRTKPAVKLGQHYAENEEELLTKLEHCTQNLL